MSKYIFISVMNSLKNVFLAESLEDFRKSLDDKRFDPYTKEEYKEVLLKLDNPDVSDKEKEEIKQDVILKNLRLIPMWWMGNKEKGTKGLKDYFSYIDEDEYQDLAVDEFMTLIKKWDPEKAKYGSFVKRALVNKLINLNKKLEKEKKRTTTAADLTKMGKEGGEISSDPLADAGGITNADFEYVMDIPVFKERTMRVKDKLKAVPDKLAFAYLTNPNFIGIKPAEVLKVYNQEAEKPISNQSLSQSIKKLKGFFKKDPLIADLL